MTDTRFFPKSRFRRMGAWILRPEDREKKEHPPRAGAIKECNNVINLWPDVAFSTTVPPALPPPQLPPSDAGATLVRFLVSRTRGQERPIKLRCWGGAGRSLPGPVSAKPALRPGNQPARRPCFLKGWGGRHGARLAGSPRQRGTATEGGMC